MRLKQFKNKILNLEREEDNAFHFMQKDADTEDEEIVAQVKKKRKPNEKAEEEKEDEEDDDEVPHHVTSSEAKRAIQTMFNFATQHGFN